MKTKISIFTLILIMNSIQIKAQDRSTDYPFLYKVTLRCRINYYANNQMYLFSYTLISDTSNRGDISTIDIDLWRGPNSVVYDTIGLKFDSHYEEWAFRRYYPLVYQNIVPVGFPLLPNMNWTGIINPNSSMAHFFVDSLMPRPGERTDNITIMSKAIPGIRSFVAKPFIWIELFFPADDTTITVTQEDSIKNAVNFHGWTVGPIAPPIIFKPSEWIDTLLSFTNRSLKYNWITTQPTADKYLAFFKSAKFSIQANNIGAARATLNLVLSAANQDSSSTLTSEAYALIRYNTEYLLQHLPNPISALDMLDTLRSRLQQAFTNNWLGDKRFKEELDRHLENAKKNLISGDSIACAQELDDFQRQLKAEYIAKPKKNDKRFVTPDGYQYLYPYAQSIVELVITLPPRSEASISDQLATLKAQIRTDAGSGLLGTEILIRGLEMMVEGAQKQLRRKDSTGTALHLMLFQQTVRLTYELTKKRFNERLYMKPAGYVSLYYRVGYILEKLPEPFGKTLPKMEPGLEQELMQYKRQVEQ